VIEAAFHAGRSEPDLAALEPFAVLLHVRVMTPVSVSLPRYRQRALDRVRHPSHDDLHFAGEMESGRKPLDVYDLRLPYPSIDVDGSDGWAPGLLTVSAFARAGVAA